MRPVNSSPEPVLKTLVLGIGNTILGDDGIGVRIVRKAAEQYGSSDVSFKETGAAGLNLLDIILGFDKLIVVDAILCKPEDTGKVFRLGPQAIKTSSGAVSAHSCGLDTALQLATKLNEAQVPREVVIIAVGIQAVGLITETLSPAVEAALPEAVALVLSEVRSEVSPAG